MGLIQTADQLRFSFLAIIEGSKNLIVKQPQPNPTTDKFKRSLAINEEETAALNVDESLLNTCPTKDEPPNVSHNLPPSDDTELRLRKNDREEKRLKTMETINRIKRKQKEVEERLKFNEKLFKYFKFMLCFGVLVCVGAVIVYKKRDSILINYK